MQIIDVRATTVSVPIEAPLRHADGRLQEMRFVLSATG